VRDEYLLLFENRERKDKRKNTIWLGSTIKGMFFTGEKNKMKNTNNNKKKKKIKQETGRRRGHYG